MFSCWPSMFFCEAPAFLDENLRFYCCSIMELLIFEVSKVFYSIFKDLTGMLAPTLWVKLNFKP
jgi:hypothetical protein